MEFALRKDDVWVGNFRPGHGRESGAYLELGRCFVLIVAGGAGYCIDAVRKELVREIGSGIEKVWFQPELAAFVIANGLRFEAFGAERTLWRSRRVSWDGMRGIDRSGLILTGEGYDPIDEKWIPFWLNLENGEALGGAAPPI